MRTLGGIAGAKQERTLGKEDLQGTAEWGEVWEQPGLGWGLSLCLCGSVGPG